MNKTKGTRELLREARDRQRLGDITLRDYFAGQALIGLLSGFYAGSTNANGHEVPNEAYMIADAMLEARKKGGEG